MEPTTGDYRIDSLGTMKHLAQLEVFSTIEAVSVGRYSVCVTMQTNDQETAQRLHPRAREILRELSSFDTVGRAALRDAYNAPAEEIAALTLSGVDVFPAGEFHLLYDLPEGEAVEYLSASFSREGVFMELGGGNY